MTPARRAAIFLATIVFIALGTAITIIFARGYRLDFSKKQLEPTGLLVATSAPDGAQVWVDGVLKSATNTTISLPPGKYSIELKRDGYYSWQKNITIKKEEVIRTEAILFPTAPSFRPITFSGALYPVISPTGDRLIFAVPVKQPATDSANMIGKPSSPSAVPNRQLGSPVLPTKSGLWILDLSEFPLGLARDPKQIVLSTNNLDWSKATISWSPDSRQILAVFMTSAKQSTVRSAYLLDPSKINLPGELVDVSQDLSTIRSAWTSDKNQLLSAQMTKLPPVAREIIASSSGKITFSPDETRILYQATASATLPNNIIPPLPGSNSQPEQRVLSAGSFYVYDLKEDKNFLISQTDHLSWFPSSRHLVKVEPGKISVLEYDDTNQVTIYSGPFFDQSVFPYPNGSKLAIVTNLGSSDPIPNLYALILR